MDRLLTGLYKNVAASSHVFLLESKKQTDVFSPNDKELISFLNQLYVFLNTLPGSFP